MALCVELCELLVVQTKEAQGHVDAQWRECPAQGSMRPRLGPWVFWADSDAATPCARVPTYAEPDVACAGGPQQLCLAQVLLMSVVLLPLCTH